MRARSPRGRCGGRADLAICEERETAVAAKRDPAAPTAAAAAAESGKRGKKRICQFEGGRKGDRPGPGPGARGGGTLQAAD